MSQPAEVIPIEKEIVPFDIEELTKSNIDLMEKQILEIPEVPEDSKQYNSVRYMNVKAKKLLPRIEERRKELKAPVLKQAKDIDATAKKAVAMIQPLIDLSGERRSAWEKVKEEEKAAKIKVEEKRLEGIQSAIAHLATDCQSALRYGRESDLIRADLAELEEWQIDEEDFQERTEEAKAILKKGISDTKAALESRLKFEQEQAELAAAKEAQAKAEAEAKAKREAEEKRIAEERAKLEAERQAVEAETRKKAEAEAEKQHQEAEKIRKEREALEAEKARIVAEEKRKSEVEGYFLTVKQKVDDYLKSGDFEAIRAYAEVLEDNIPDTDPDFFKDRTGEFNGFMRSKISEISNYCHGVALKMNAEFDRQKLAKKRAEAMRLEELKPDKERLKDYVLKISEIPEPEMATEEGKSWMRAVNHELSNAVDMAMGWIEA